jgi:hypothetical protein
MAIMGGSQTGRLPAQRVVGPITGGPAIPICPTGTAAARPIVIMGTTATHTVAIMARALTDQMESSDREGITQIQRI